MLCILGINFFEDYGHQTTKTDLDTGHCHCSHQSSEFVCQVGSLVT